MHDACMADPGSPCTLIPAFCAQRVAGTSSLGAPNHGTLGDPPDAALLNTRPPLAFHRLSGLISLRVRARGASLSRRVDPGTTGNTTRLNPSVGVLGRLSVARGCLLAGAPVRGQRAMSLGGTE